MKKLFAILLLGFIMALISNAAQTVTVDNNGIVIYPTGPITFLQDLNILGGSLVISNASPTVVTNLIIIGSISSPTNSTLSDTILDFGIQYSTTNITGNISFTSMANYNPTNYNRVYIYVIPNGGNRTVTVPSSWQSGDGLRTWTATNGTMLKLEVELQVGAFTNISAIHRW